MMIGKRLGLFVAIILLLVSCQTQKQGFPTEMDIVFQTADDSQDQIGLGFVSAGGGPPVFQSLSKNDNPPKWPPAWPVWTPDGEQIIARQLQGRNAVSAWGFIVYGANGYVKQYEEVSVFAYPRGAAVTDDSEYAIFLAGDSVDYELVKFELETGATEKVYTIPSKNFDHGSRVLHPPYLVYALLDIVTEYSGRPPGYLLAWHAKIILVDLDTQLSQLLAEEMWLSCPAIAPNGRWVTYVGADGIYVIDLVEDSQPRLLVEFEVVRVRPETSEFETLVWTPIPSWSPDSEWIVYHSCNLAFTVKACAEMINNDIYKVNVTTGERVLLVEGGLNPYWRLNPP